MIFGEMGSQFATTLLGLFSGVGLMCSLFLMGCRRLGYTYYTIEREDEQHRFIVKRLNPLVFSSGMTHQRGEMIPSGLFIGNGCIGYMSSSLSIFTSDVFMKKLLEEEAVHTITPMPISTEKVATKTHTILWARSGNYSNIYYNKLKIRTDSFFPKGDQGQVVQDIISIYRVKGTATIFLEGASGTGKSTVGILLAKQLGGSLCHSFNPTNPGDSLNYVYDYSDTSDQSPLILILEEVNTMIHAITDNKIPLHKNLHTVVYNKTTFNTFLDDICMYKNIILVMTSNESKESIDAIDPSYLRKGRVDASIVMRAALDTSDALK
jgi:hypothetical protein